MSAVAALGACRQDRSDQNIAVDNEVTANGSVEALPPDESVATSTNELENGADNADVGDLNDTSNDY